MKNLKTLSITLVLLFTFSALLILTGNPIPAKEKKAKIYFNELSHDFGKVEEGIELSHTFKFKNSGNAPLIIQSVNAGCGCTGATVGDKKEYLEGEEGEIKVTFHTQGRSGLQSKTVSVQTNDPENPNIVLTFSCEVISAQ